MNYDYKVIRLALGTWIVRDKDGYKVAGPFNTAIAAGGWARDRLLRDTVRKWNGDKQKREEKRS